MKTISNIKIANLLEEHILEVLDYDQDGIELISVKDKVNFLRDKFTSEYNWRLKQVGELLAYKDYLQGLAINIEFYNFNILQLFEKNNLIDPIDDLTEDQCIYLVELYWKSLASAMDSLLNNTCRYSHEK